MRHSPLCGLLEHVFDAAQGDGDWSIPLQLTIPLRRVRDTSVRGPINFHDGRITPLAGMPPLTTVTGSLNFLEDGVTASHIMARFIGGSVAINGGVPRAVGGFDFPQAEPTKPIGP